MKNKILDYFQSINCINVSIHGGNCCKTGIATGIAVSKCVYLASMAVKIEHTVAGHNHDILQQCIFDVHASGIMGPQPELKMSNICFCSSKFICIHRKLNKNKMCNI